MIIKVFPDNLSLATSAAQRAAHVIRQAIDARGEARIIAATGASQFDFLDLLIAEKNIDWTRVEMFHLDEYVGLSDQAPASFCKYLRERLIQPAGILRYHLLDGTRPPPDVIAEATSAIRTKPIDIAFAGIGENGHLAFNDPPANFTTEASYLVVNLDEACRRQQFNEGWFPTLDAVPRQAISMSIPEILKAREILVCALEVRKAEAIHACFDGGVSPEAPASILQQHPNATLYLDADSASLLSKTALQKFTA